ncbi:hypothetical protein [Sphingomonas alba]|uniref:Uncharacterized protein n=1 Tax=Sphingomonas alba TaxID=2908208 RepID=A0ABT0RPR7_9SPHN|nr:hypothetical protein [Sphingomonas alba]MCL6684457.1 hypothetical protein [Sphingomonas alba]
MCFFGNRVVQALGKGFNDYQERQQKRAEAEDQAVAERDAKNAGIDAVLGTLNSERQATSQELQAVGQSLQQLPVNALITSQDMAALGLSPLASAIADIGRYGLGPRSQGVQQFY